MSFFLITSVAASSTTLYAIYFFSKEIKSDSLAQMRQSMQVAQLVYHTQMERVADIAHFISSDETLQSLSFFGIQQKINSRLQQIQEGHPSIAQILVISGRNKRLLGSAEKNTYTCLATEGTGEDTGEDTKDEAQDKNGEHPLFASVMQQARPHSATELITCGEQSLLGIVAAAPFFRETLGKEVFGVVLVRYILNENTALVEKINHLLGVNVLISHQSQTINQYLLAQSTPPQISASVKTVLQQRGFDEMADIRPGGQLAAHQVLKNSLGKQIGVLSLSVPADEFVQVSNQAMFRLIGIMLICIVLATLLGYFMAHNILTPIEYLQRGVKRLTSGDLSHVFTWQRDDELGILAQAFNSMAKQLNGFVNVLKDTIDTLTRAGNALSAEKDLNNLLEIFVKEARSITHADTGILYTLSAGALQFRIMQSASQEVFARNTSANLGYDGIPLSKAAHQLSIYAAKHQRRVYVAAGQKIAPDGTPMPENLAAHETGHEAMLVVPMLDRSHQTIGVLQLINPEHGKHHEQEPFSENQIEIVSALASQAAVAVENALSYEKIQTQNMAFQRFVPTEFLTFLGKTEIEDIQVGDASVQHMSVLFSDIRAFTSLSEDLPPEQAFLFLNDYLKWIGPGIVQSGGFIDKYIGDAIMALFCGEKITSADDAVAGAINMLSRLQNFNQMREKEGKFPVNIGIGIHTGALTLGTIGFEGRLESTVIGDTVNLAARVESLTKHYGIYFGITSDTLQALKHPDKLLIRELDTVQVQGKETANTVYEVFNHDPEMLKNTKLKTLAAYNKAQKLYKSQQWVAALSAFEQLAQQLPEDRVIQLYCERCQHYQQHPPAPDWNGITRLAAK
ncbi:adenylate/guanylate cyclase domain-containing protein [Candidatus Venteria ishoeyi]|uniref:adenylate/guanylate cyclase domain-containing protein n=1 Tax=Candidatus Venteria ishoeyi TaxID=1899563 RepID=UPI0015AE21AC|nr:adenylate/guanylate cyclase domain-containing protein [Candidatus Venteria ishoeyi]